MDNNRFLEVTRRICGSLDIDEALYDVFLYLKQELPLDAILITIYEMNLPQRPETAPGALEKLADYDWPGNVRELQNIVERALIVSGGSPLKFFGFHAPGMAESPAPSLTESHVATLDEITAAHIRLTLEKTLGRIGGKGGAADLLGIHPSTLRSRLKKLAIPYGKTK